MMNEEKNIKGSGAQEKMRALLNQPKVLMMATALDKIPFSVCPMTLVQMDEHGLLWFFSKKDSDHFRDIEKDSRVQLIYADVPYQKYISIYGNATHIVDVQKINELWSDNLNDWFDGIKDPNLALLKVSMYQAYYWDHTAYKLVSFSDQEEEFLDKKHSIPKEKGYLKL
jgi:general stress protein 26